ncbi:hypothetical protein CPC08DRAFT_703765 [Agrocybe pediades]|nr:hypothetical protein CPC08DRAFT_703765 [Agrocybe pediades]
MSFQQTLLEVDEQFYNTFPDAKPVQHPTYSYSYSSDGYVLTNIDPLHYDYGQASTSNTVPYSQAHPEQAMGYGYANQVYPTYYSPDIASTDVYTMPQGPRANVEMSASLFAQSLVEAVTPSTDSGGRSLDAMASTLGLEQLPLVPKPEATGPVVAPVSLPPPAPRPRAVPPRVLERAPIRGTPWTNPNYSVTQAQAIRPASMRLSPLPSMRQLEKKPPLACLFCRGRKIACGPPIAGSPDKTCNQCQKRSLRCEYPSESRRGMRKKKTVDASDTTNIDNKMTSGSVASPTTSTSGSEAT